MTPSNPSALDQDGLLSKNEFQDGFNAFRQKEAKNLRPEAGLGFPSPKP